MTPGLIQGFSDVLTPYPYITNYAFTVNYALNPTTFLEGTYGFIRNELTGGNENGVLVNESSNRLTSMPGFPMLYADAGVIPTNSYGARGARRRRSAVVGRHESQPAAELRLGQPRQGNAGTCAAPSVPCQRYPGWLNINRTQDVAISVTKVAGRHTFKGGFYNNHSFKAQNVGAGGIANLTFQGYVNFGNDTNNALDTGYGYANAATGVFTQYLQASKFVEGSMHLQQHRVLRAGQLEGQQSPDPRLRPPLHAPAAAVRPVPADVELLPRSVVGFAGTGVLRRRLQQRRDHLLGQHA